MQYKTMNNFFVYGYPQPQQYLKDEDWQINLMLWNLTFPMECKEQLKFAHNLSHELFLPQERKAAILSFQLSMKWHFRKMVISLLDNLTIMKAVPQYTSSYIPVRMKDLIWQVQVYLQPSHRMWMIQHKKSVKSNQVIFFRKESFL